MPENFFLYLDAGKLLSLCVFDLALIRAKNGSKEGMKRTMPKMLSAFRLVRLPRAIIFFLLAFPLIMVGPGLGFADQDSTRS